MEPGALIAEVDRALPGFADYFRSPENLFDSYTPHGVFASCSHFVREHPVPAGAWRRIARLLNEVAAGSDVTMAEAACSCFLENLAEPGHPLRNHLTGEALRYWQRYEGAG